MFAFIWPMHKKSIGQTNAGLLIRLICFYLQALKGLIFLLVEERIKVT